MTKIIINADDLGIDYTVNQEIEQYIKNGLITSATILSNGSAFDDAVRIAKENDHISYGVHLCLDEFNCITESKMLQKYWVVDDKFNFEKGIYRVKKPSKELKQAINNELSEQIELILNEGIKITHIDSHHHFHTQKIWLLKIVCEVAKKYKINTLRRPISRLLLSRNIPMKPYNKKTSNIKNDSIYFIINKLYRGSILLKKIARNHLFNLITKRKFKMVDAFFSYYTYVNISKLATKYQYNSIELMCHPGHIEYQVESELVKQKALDKIMKCDYISYKQFVNEGITDFK